LDRFYNLETDIHFIDFIYGWFYDFKNIETVEICSKG